MGQTSATESQIAKVEQIVGFDFPSELRELLMELNGDKWLFYSTEEISERTQVAGDELQDCYPDIDRHIFFAGNGYGDYYCYKVSDEGSVDSQSIFIWQHEENKTNKVASNIKELIQRYYNDEI